MRPHGRHGRLYLSFWPQAFADAQSDEIRTRIEDLPPTQRPIPQRRLGQCARLSRDLRIFHSRATRPGLPYDELTRYQVKKIDVCRYRFTQPNPVTPFPS